MAGEHLTADALTKSLPRERFWYLIGLLGLQQAQPQPDVLARISQRSPEAVRRALIAVLCLASVVPTTAQGHEGARAEYEKGEDRVWMFWVVIVLVIILAWEGTKLGICHVKTCLCLSRRTGTGSRIRTVGTQTGGGPTYCSGPCLWRRPEKTEPVSCWRSPNLCQ